MIGGSDLLWGGVVPGAVAAIVLAGVWQLTGKAASAWRTALVVGYLAGHWGLDSRNIAQVAELSSPNLQCFVTALAKSFQPTEASDWLPLLLLLAIVPDALACVGKRGPVLGWLLRAGLCLFLPWRLLYGSSYLPLSLGPGFDFDFGGWSTGEAAAWIGGIAAALVLCWQLARLGDQQKGIFVGSTLAVVVALGGAITTALSGSLIYGQLLGVLTATLVGCGLVSALLKTGRGPATAAGPMTIAFGSLLIVGHFYAGLKIHNAAALLLAMLLAIGWLPLPKKLSPRWQIVCRSLLCLAALSTAVTLARLDYAATQVEAASNPYQNFQP